MIKDGDDEALIAAATAEDEQEACRAVKQMGRFGSKALPGLRAAMKDKRPAVRTAAVIAISRAAQDEDVAVMSEMIKSADQPPEVKAGIALTFGRMRAYTETETLLDALDDDDVNVRRRANFAIEKILGISESFNASAPKEARDRSAKKLRDEWIKKKEKTIFFYESQKKRPTPAGKG